MVPTEIEIAYQQGIDALTPTERMARVESFLAWTRKTIGRRVVAELGPGLSPERLRCEVALRMYGDDPRIERLIREHLEHVPA
jgi:hypothetical protein